MGVEVEREASGHGPATKARTYASSQSLNTNTPASTGFCSAPAITHLPAASQGHVISNLGKSCSPRHTIVHNARHVIQGRFDSIHLDLTCGERRSGRTVVHHLLAHPEPPSSLEPPTISLKMCSRLAVEECKPLGPTSSCALAPAMWSARNGSRRSIMSGTGAKAAPIQYTPKPFRCHRSKERILDVTEANPHPAPKRNDEIRTLHLVKGHYRCPHERPDRGLVRRRC